MVYGNFDLVNLSFAVITSSGAATVIPAIDMQVRDDQLFSGTYSAFLDFSQPGGIRHHRGYRRGVMV